MTYHPAYYECDACALRISEKDRLDGWSFILSKMFCDKCKKKYEKKIMDVINGK